MNTGEDEPAWLTDDNPPWFSVRCVVRLSVYEERITLWRTNSFEEAIAMAEVEVREYAEVLGGKYVGLAQSYRLGDAPGSGAEVFSLLRSSSLGPSQYLDAFFDTGSEFQGQPIEGDG